MSTALSATTSTPNIDLSIHQATLTLQPLTYKPLHNTFVAEVQGADLTQPSPKLIKEIKKGLAKVSPLSCRKDLISDRHEDPLNKSSMECWSSEKRDLMIIPM
jgi:hypothetical protein